LKQAEVEVELDPSGKAETILVTGLAASFSNEATSEALEMTNTPKGDQIAKVNTATLEILKFHHGCVDPKFSTAEAEQIATKYGPAFTKVVEKIDELSGTSPEDVAKVQARFPGSATGEGRPDVGNGASAGDAGPVVPARTGA
jgi:hypothetical protein